ncbi:MAG: carbohydrate-binding family 9-like protein, partial [Thermoanaerobaculia bacterium]
MPEANPSEIAVSRLAATSRLVSLTPRELLDARTGAAPTLKTALRLGWRDDRLLVRFDCRCRDVVATLREDNADLWTEDVVEAFLSFEDPPARYLELEVNPLGAKFSARVESPNLAREGMTVERIALPGFRADVRAGDRRWSATLSIPLGDTLERLSTAAGLRDPEGKRTAAEGR